MRSSRLFSTVIRAVRFTRGESAAGVQIAAARRRKVKANVFFMFMGVLLTNNSVGSDVHLLELLIVHFVGRAQLGRLPGFHCRYRLSDRGIDLRLLQSG